MLNKDDHKTVTLNNFSKTQKLKSPAKIAPVGLFSGNQLSISLPVRKHSHVLAAAVLKNDSFTGLVIDLVSLPACLRHVFGRRLMTVAE